MFGWKEPTVFVGGYTLAILLKPKPMPISSITSQGCSISARVGGISTLIRFPSADEPTTYKPILDAQSEIFSTSRDSPRTLLMFAISTSKFIYSRVGDTSSFSGFPS